MAWRCTGDKLLPEVMMTNFHDATRRHYTTIRSLIHWLCDTNHKSVFHVYWGSHVYVKQMLYIWINLFLGTYQTPSMTKLSYWMKINPVLISFSRCYLWRENAYTILVCIKSLTMNIVYDKNLFKQTHIWVYIKCHWLMGLLTAQVTEFWVSVFLPPEWG